MRVVPCQGSVLGEKGSASPWSGILLWACGGDQWREKPTDSPSNLEEFSVCWCECLRTFVCERVLWMWKTLWCGATNRNSAIRAPLTEETRKSNSRHWKKKGRARHDRVVSANIRSTAIAVITYRCRLRLFSSGFIWRTDFNQCRNKQDKPFRLVWSGRQKVLNFAVTKQQQSAAYSLG